MLKRAKMASGTVCVIPGKEPANISVAPNSPSARPHASAIPEVIPCPAHGTATRMKAPHRVQPSIMAAYSIDGSMPSKKPFISHEKKQICTATWGSSSPV